MLQQRCPNYTASLSGKVKLWPERQSSTNTQSSPDSQRTQLRIDEMTVSGDELFLPSITMTLTERGETQIYRIGTDFMDGMDRVDRPRQSRSDLFLVHPVQSLVKC